MAATRFDPARVVGADRALLRRAKSENHPGSSRPHRRTPAGGAGMKTYQFDHLELLRTMLATQHCTKGSSPPLPCPQLKNFFSGGTRVFFHGKIYPASKGPGSGGGIGGRDNSSVMRAARSSAATREHSNTVTTASPSMQAITTRPDSAIVTAELVNSIVIGAPAANARPAPAGAPSFRLSRGFFPNNCARGIWSWPMVPNQQPLSAIAQSQSGAIAFRTVQVLAPHSPDFRFRCGRAGRTRPPSTSPTQRASACAPRNTGSPESASRQARRSG